MGDWIKTTLGNFVTLQRGHDLTASQRQIGPIPVMGSAGVNGYHDEARAKGPGVTIGRSGVGSMGVVSYSPVDYWPHNTVLYVTDFHSNDPKFTYYFLQQQNLRRFDSGSAQASLNRNYLYPIEIEVPEPQEQHAIARILGSLDDKIELNRRQNATLEELARAIFQSWFVDFDPVRARAEGRTPAAMDAATAALFPDGFDVVDGREVPRGWDTAPLSNLCEYIMSGGTPDTRKEEYWGGSIPWLSSGETRERFIVTTEKTITPLGVNESSTRMARAGSIVIAGAGQGYTRGQTSLLLFDSYINQSVVAVAANHVLISDLYIFFDLARRYEEFRQISDSHSSRGSLTTKLLGNIQVLRPPIQLVAAFDQLVKPIVEKVRSNLQQSRTLTALRDTLLPRLLSGELRVRVAEEIIEDAL